MYALIENNAVTQVGELAILFPDTSNPNASFAAEQGALEVVEGEQKDQRFYWVTFDKYEVTGNVVTRTYTNTPKALEDVLATNKDGLPIYVQVFDATVGERGAMVDTINPVINPSQWESCKVEGLRLNPESDTWLAIDLSPDRKQAALVSGTNIKTVGGASLLGSGDVGTIGLAYGGTGATTASGARTALGLGTAAVLNAGVAGGVATLDGSGTVPTSQLPGAVLGGLNYQLLILLVLLNGVC